MTKSRAIRLPEEVQTALTARHITVKNTTYVPQTTSDMASAVKAASSGGVSGVTTNLAPRSGSAADSGKTAGGTQKIAFASTILTPQTLQQAGSNADGALAAGSFPSLTQTSIPAILQYNDDMKKYEPGKPLDDFSLNGWGGMQLLKLVAGKLKNATPATLMKALNSINNEPFLWITHFSTKPNPTPGFSRIFNTTVFMEKVVNGKFVQQGSPVVLTH